MRIILHPHLHSLEWCFNQKGSHEIGNHCCFLWPFDMMNYFKTLLLWMWVAKHAKLTLFLSQTIMISNCSLLLVCACAIRKTMKICTKGLFTEDQTFILYSHRDSSYQLLDTSQWRTLLLSDSHEGNPDEWKRNTRTNQWTRKIQSFNSTLMPKQHCTVPIHILFSFYDSFSKASFWIMGYYGRVKVNDWHNNNKCNLYCA